MKAAATFAIAMALFAAAWPTASPAQRLTDSLGPPPETAEAARRHASVLSLKFAA